MSCARIAATVCYNRYITRYARAYQRPHDVICDYERDAVRWCKILHLTWYGVSDAVRNLLALRRIHFKKGSF
jgi:hypothetical protein